MGSGNVRHRLYPINTRPQTPISCKLTKDNQTLAREICYQYFGTRGVNSTGHNNRGEVSARLVAPCHKVHWEGDTFAKPHSSFSLPNQKQGRSGDHSGSPRWKPRTSRQTSVTHPENPSRYAGPERRQPKTILSSHWPRRNFQSIRLTEVALTLTRMPSERGSGSGMFVNCKPLGFQLRWITMTLRSNSS